MNRIELARKVENEFNFETDEMFHDTNIRLGDYEERREQLALIFERKKLIYEDQFYLGENLQYLNSKTFNALMPRLIVAYLNLVFKPDENFSQYFSVILGQRNHDLSLYCDDGEYRHEGQSRLHVLRDEFLSSLSTCQENIYYQAEKIIRADFHWLSFQ